MPKPQRLLVALFTILVGALLYKQHFSSSHPNWSAEPVVAASFPPPRLADVDHGSIAAVGSLSPSPSPTNAPSQEGPVLLVSGYHHASLRSFLVRLRRELAFHGHVVVLSPVHLHTELLRRGLDSEWNGSALGPVTCVAVPLPFPSTAARYGILAVKHFMIKSHEESWLLRWQRQQLYAFVDVANTFWCKRDDSVSVFSQLPARCAKRRDCLVFAEHSWGVGGGPSARRVPSPYFLAGTSTSLRRFVDSLDSANDLVKDLQRAASRHANAAIWMDGTQFLALTPRSCLNVTSPAAYCEQHSDAAVLLDINICVKEDGDHVGFCPSLWSDMLYELSGEVSPHRSSILDNALPLLTSALRGLSIDETHRQILSLPYRPFLNDGNNRSAVVCPRGRTSVILGLAAGYAPTKVHDFVESFLLHGRRAAAKRGGVVCTTLVLFVTGAEKFRSYRPGWNDSQGHVEWEEIDDFPITLRPTCAISERRMEIYYEWMSRKYGLKRTRNRPGMEMGIEHGMIGIVDVRDVFFQGDLFDSLSRSAMWPELTANQKKRGDEWLLLPAESFAASDVSPYAPGVIGMYEFWIESAFGASYRQALQRTPITAAANEAPPVICSGVMLGSGRAMFALMSAMRTALKPTGCHVDQALLTMLTFDGLQLSGFPWPVLVANPERSVMRNGYERASDVLWKDNTAVNCLGEPYALLHQIERPRHPWLWPHLASLHLAGKRPNVKPQPSFSSFGDRRQGGDECSEPDGGEPRVMGPAGGPEDVLFLSAIRHAAGASPPDGVIRVVKAVRNSGCNATIVVIHSYSAARDEFMKTALMEFYPAVLFPAAAVPQEWSWASQDEQEELTMIASVHSFLTTQRLSKDRPTGRVVALFSSNVMWHQDIFRFVGGNAASALYVSQSSRQQRLVDEFSSCRFFSRSVVQNPKKLVRFTHKILAASSASVLMQLLLFVAEVDMLRNCPLSAAFNTVLHHYAPLVAPRVVAWTTEYGPVVVFDEVLCQSGANAQVHQSPPKVVCSDTLLASVVVDACVR